MRPSGSRTATRRRGARAAVGVLLMTVAMAAFGAPPASAHTELVSSTPSDGSTSDVGPSRIVLTFNEAPASVTSVLAESSNGTPVALGSPSTSGRKVIVAWPAAQLAGVYRVVYSLISDDGDPVTGTLVFGYRAARSPTPGSISDGASADPGSGSPSPSPTAGSPGPTTVASPASSSGGPVPAAAPPTDAGGTSTWFVAAGLVAAVVLGAAVLLLRRRRGATSSDA